MEMEAGSTSAPSGGTQVHYHLPLHSRAFYKFTQQNLPACRPQLTSAWVVAIFLITGGLFIPTGLVCLRASESVVEIVERYDVECVPETYRSNKVAYIKNSLITKKCDRLIKIQKHMKAPIYVYYELDNYYQNHRRYVKSRCDKQLLHGLEYEHTSSCKPEEHNGGLPIVPCGLVAWSLFNDSYAFVRETVEMKVNRKNIAWASDQKHKFGRNVYPFNFQNGSLIGGANLDPDVPLSEQEDLIVWMRTAALPKFRKLYGIIEEDLVADDSIEVHILNNYNTYSFGGKKKLILTTQNWLGGKNSFLGIAYMVTGILCVLLAIAFALLHVKYPRFGGSWSLLIYSYFVACIAGLKPATQSRGAMQRPKGRRSRQRKGGQGPCKRPTDWTAAGAGFLIGKDQDEGRASQPGSRALHPHPSPSLPINSLFPSSLAVS